MNNNNLVNTVLKVNSITLKKVLRFISDNHIDKKILFFKIIEPSFKKKLIPISFELECLILAASDRALSLNTTNKEREYTLTEISDYIAKKYQALFNNYNDSFDNVYFRYEQYSINSNVNFTKPDYKIDQLFQFILTNPALAKKDLKKYLETGRLGEGMFFDPYFFKSSRDKYTLELIINNVIPEYLKWLTNEIKLII